MTGAHGSRLSFRQWLRYRHYLRVLVDAEARRCRDAVGPFRYAELKAMARRAAKAVGQ